MKRVHFEVAQTAVTILAEEEYVPVAREAIFEARGEIESYARRDEWFLSTIEAYPPPDDAPPLIRRMCEASTAAGVGPMAAVAGAIAEVAVGTMAEAGASHAIVDNGGDLALLLERETDVGLYSGNERFRDLALRCPAREEVHGICSSSGRVGPSLSLGATDLATVVCQNVALADACATRLGNMVTSADERLITEALGRICSIDGVEGALVIIDDRIAWKGILPRLIRRRFAQDRISRIEL